MSLVVDAERFHAPDPPSGSDIALDAAIERARAALVALQRPDGHFIFELEADAAIPAEYVLVKHFLGEIDPEMERRNANYLRGRQEAHGGWPKLIGGDLDISASVKSYFALKLMGDPVDAPHMVRAREGILKAGGAVNVNIFTRMMLAYFGIVPWNAVPVMPVEIMHAPAWFPFHLFKISFWARCTLVPLLVMMALKPRAANPRGVGLDELFVVPPHKVRRWPRTANQGGVLGTIFIGLDKLLRRIEPLFTARSRASAIDKAVAFARERLNGDDGFGAIYPSIAYTVMMFHALGLPRDHPDTIVARAAFEKLVRHEGDIAYCQPCLSPVWDTVLAAYALLEAGLDEALPEIEAALDWLAPCQILDFKGDWAVARPHLRPGGWAFMYNNPCYPDLDDTAAVVMAMDRFRVETGTRRFDEAIARGREWVLGMQSGNGGWGAYDADNTAYYLNAIPFADHGALLDPPTVDVSARCISMLGQLGERPATSHTLARALDYVLAEQHAEGSWFGRWGMNYIYGTWSVLSCLKAIDFDQRHAAVRRAVVWLESIQNADGGWGEDDNGYDVGYAAYRSAPSTASQTAWALLGLLAVGEAHRPSVERGIAYLRAAQTLEGEWDEDRHTATGFPRVFYLRYGGYAKFFPLMALARYRNTLAGELAGSSFGL